MQIRPLLIRSFVCSLVCSLARSLVPYLEVHPLRYDKDKCVYCTSTHQYIVGAGAGAGAGGGGGGGGRGGGGGGGGGQYTIPPFLKGADPDL